MRTFCKTKKGIALILAYSVTAALLVLSLAMIQRAVSAANQARIKKLNTQAFYLAEAALERGVFQLVQAVADNHDEGVPASSTGNIVAGLSADFTLSYDWQEQAAGENKYTDAKGVVVFKKLYKITGRAVHNQYSISSTANQLISRNKTYTFQHAVFYADDLEVLPGSQQMTLSGRIHGNDDIYLGSRNLLKLDSDYIRSAANIYNVRKDNPSDIMAGGVKIKAQGSNYALMYDIGLGDSNPLDCRRSDWYSASQDRWKGNIKSAAHGITALAVPCVGSIQPDGYYGEKAEHNGLKITKKIDGSWDVYSNGTLLSQATVNGLISGGLLDERTIYNEREGDEVMLIDVDISKFKDAAYSSYFPANGLIYATRQDAEAGSPNGVRLKSGSELLNGLTVVSNDPIYILGNYNNVSKKPASVIGDSLNILSGKWKDSVSGIYDYSFGAKIAEDTTVNAAFIAGIKSTEGSDYSGGLENYPRLHENWDSADLTINGSFVELWNSIIATGDWVYGSPYYTAPTRIWNYDSAFNDENNLPPFTPFAVEAEKIAWWQN